MKVNGTQVPLQEEKTLLQYLQENQYDISKIAVERNGEIVPKREYECVFLQQEDQLEIVNGKDREGTWKTAYEVPAVSPKGEFIRILNGFQIEKDIPLKEGDILTVIPKGTMPDERELESMMAARHTPHVHERVKKAKVGIAGLGGLGSHIAVMCAWILTKWSPAI